MLLSGLFDVYNHPGSGFLEIVYKDALAHELRLRDIPYEREKEFTVTSKDHILSHKFYADFVVFDKIILEVKSVENLHEKHFAQCINYLKVSGCTLAILANFPKDLLDHRRIVL